MHCMSKVCMSVHTIYVYKKKSQIRALKSKLNPRIFLQDGAAQADVTKGKSSLLIHHCTPGPTQSRDNTTRAEGNATKNTHITWEGTLWILSTLCKKCTLYGKPCSWCYCTWFQWTLMCTQFFFKSQFLFRYQVGLVSRVTKAPNGLNIVFPQWYNSSIPTHRKIIVLHWSNWIHQK